MQKPWLNEYPDSVPHEIDPSRYASLKALAEDGLARHADRPAYLQMGRTLTFGEIDALSAAFACWLQQQGLAKGDRIAIMLPNLLQYPVAMLGALRAGLVVVNSNPLYTADELRHQLDDSGATAIVVVENFCHVVAEVAAQTPLRHVVVTGVGDLLGFPRKTLVNFALRHVRRAIRPWNIPGAVRFTDALAQHAGQRPADVSLSSQDLAFLQYTGGTTGVAKGAMLTHGNMVANALQARGWFEQVGAEHATYYIALPLYHIFSLTGNLLLHLLTGGTGIMVPDPRDFGSFIRQLQKHPPQILLGVNTLFNALMNTPGFDGIDFRGLVATVGGGMAVQEAVAERWQRLTGCTLSQGWGLTETSPIVTANKLGNTPFNGSTGLPLPSTEVSSRDDAGNDLGFDQTGEICVRGPQVMAGYWNQPEETALVMLPDGWLRTGDIGRIDQRGYVFLEDRKKDMISVSGLKVYPNEVEAVAARHPGIFESAAIAEPDPHSGEVVALYVVRKDPALTADDITRFMRQHLTSYKVPRHVYFRTELPKTNVGKILRRAVRDHPD